MNIQLLSGYINQNDIVVLSAFLLMLIYAYFTYGSSRQRTNKKSLEKRRALVIGNDFDGDIYIKKHCASSQMAYSILGVLTNSPNDSKSNISNAKIIGNIGDLSDIIVYQEVSDVFCLPSISRIDEIQRYEKYFADLKVNFITFKNNDSDSNITNKTTHIDEHKLYDVLNRKRFRPNISKHKECYSNKTILVTGAGGSIGGETCKKLIDFNPQRLILLGHGENSLHNIYNTLKSTNKNTELIISVASITDKSLLNQIFDKYDPDIVIHTAAHKHVPLMEINPIEATKNNVFGTLNVIKACSKHKTNKMIMMSTDKAVYPSCVMGATKWICEELMKIFSQKYPSTSFITVRSGNVLGSRGSVIPLFCDQIAKGGPVVVTHPNMTRYFLLLSEIADLILSAGSIGESGNIYLLDMGSPIRILDLASEVVKLSGYMPGSEIQISFSGIRNGEKLHEDLYTKDETLHNINNGGLFCIKSPNFITENNMRIILSSLYKNAVYGDSRTISSIYEEIIPKCQLTTPNNEEIKQSQSYSNHR